MQHYLYQYINNILLFYDDETVFNISSTVTPFVYNIAKSTPKVYFAGVTFMDF